MTVVGKPVVRVDGRLKVTGGAVFAADTALAHYAHAVIATSVVARGHARVDLEAASAGFDRVVKTTIFLIDMNDFAGVNAVYGEYFTESPPARSTVAVGALPKGARVEIEVVAQL